MQLVAVGMVSHAIPYLTMCVVRGCGASLQKTRTAGQVQSAEDLTSNPHQESNMGPCGAPKGVPLKHLGQISNSDII